LGGAIGAEGSDRDGAASGRPKICGIRAGDEVFGDFVPGDVDVEVRESRSLRIASIMAAWLAGRRRCPQAHVSPDDGGLRVALEEGLDLIEVGGAGTFFCKRNINVVVKDNHQAGFGGEIEDRSRAGSVRLATAPGILAETNSL